MEKVKEYYRRYKFIVWPVCTGVSALAILGLVIIPQIFTYLNTQDKLTSLKNRSVVLEAKAQGLEKIDSTSNKQHLQNVFRVLPQEQNVPEAMLTIQSLVNQSGLLLKNTTYSNARSNAGGNRFQLNITVLGTINSVRNFLLSLKESPRVFQVESLSLQFQKGGSLIEADMPVSVYFAPANKVSSALEQPLPQLDEQEEQLLTTLGKVAPLSIGSILESTSSAVPLGKADPFE